MKTVKYILFSIIVLLNLSAFSQSKKLLKEHKINSETVYVTKVVDGKEVELKDSKTVYDKNGKVIEEEEYNKQGELKKTTKSKYNSDKDKIEETIYDGKGVMISRTTFIYNSSGEKVGEIEYDGKNNIVKQSITVFDSKGFKVEKKTYDGNKKLISTKKYVYTKR